MPDGAWWSLFVVGAYLAGAVPFGFVIARAKGIDIRAHGSGNIGATNVRRVLGSGPGNLCFALDVLKGALPVVVSGLVMGTLGAGAVATTDAWWWLGVALATVLGHVFPVYLRFKGGKGVATALGSLASMWPIVTPAALIALALWIVTVKTTRYVSVASCVAAVALPVAVLGLRLAGWAAPASSGIAGVVPFLVVTGLLGVLVLVRHKGNLSRVLRGEESKIGQNT